MTPFHIFKCVLFASTLGVLAGCNRTGKPEAGHARPAEEKKERTEVIVPVARQEGIIGVETVAAGNQPESIQAPGVIVLPDTSSWHIGVLVTGRIESVAVNLGDMVRKGQILARMHSHDVHEARADYATARSDLARAEANAFTAQKNLDRAERLYALKAGSVVDVERARQELTNAQAAIRNEQIALEKEKVHLQDVLGVDPDPAPGAHNDDADLIPIRSTGEGYVLAKNVTPGTVVDPSKDAFVIGDLKHLWMMASVGDANLSKMRVGLRASVTAKAFPDVSFPGRITNLSPQLDPLTRTMTVRIELDNPALRLRPEMLATVEIEAGASRPVIRIPGESVQQINGQDVVFVRTSEDRFEIRPIRIGQSMNGRVTILEGLKAGDIVVVRGSFVLKSQLLKASIEEGD